MNDEIIEEVWQVKEKLAAKYGHDLNKMACNLRERERHSTAKVIDLRAHKKETEHFATQ